MVRPVSASLSLVFREGPGVRGGGRLCALLLRCDAGAGGGVGMRDSEVCRIHGWRVFPSCHDVQLFK